MISAVTTKTQLYGSRSRSRNGQKLSLLSLDGGGVRGLSALLILKILMAEINSQYQKMGLPRVKPCEVFDLIGGTSTGGLVAIMLGRLEMDIDECIITYTSLMKSIFEESAFLVDWTGCVKSRFNLNVLEREIKSVITAKGHTESELFNDGVDRKCKVFVCAITSEIKMISQLRSYDVVDYKNNNMTIWQAALATSVATPCFDPVTIGNYVYMDGGKEANNPVHLTELEAQKIWSPIADNMRPLAMCLISLGPGRLAMNHKLDKGIGLLSKALLAILIETERTSERFIPNWEGKHFNGYFRFSVEHGLDEVGLAEYEMSGVVKAATDAYMNSEEQKLKLNDCVKEFYKNQSRVVKDFFPSTTHFGVNLLQEGSQKWEVPYFRHRGFVGRETELGELERVLAARDGYQGVAAITGLGGIGKTQIAVEYCYKMKEEQQTNCSVFWIDAGNKMNFDQSYLKIGRALQISGIDNENIDFKQLVTTRLSLETGRQWLLVIDNANDLSMFFNSTLSYIPNNCKGSIIFTTRNRNIAIALTRSWSNVIEIREMNMIDSKLMLMQALLKNVSDDDSSDKLLEILGYLPLAIVKVADYLNETNSSIQEYIMLRESCEQLMIEYPNTEFYGCRQYLHIQNAISNNWFTSFNRIRKDDQLAMDYLAFMSLVDWSPIPESMLPPAKTPIAMSHALETLKAYFFVKTHQVEHLNGSEEFYDMSRLVQLAIRDWLRSQGELVEYSRKALERVANAFSIGGSENTSGCKTYLPHARYILRSSELPAEVQQTKIDLLRKIARCLSMKGHHDEAYPLVLRHLAESEKLFGPKHPITLRSIQQLASNLADQKRFSESESVCHRAIGVMKETLGPEHADTLASLSLLAVVLEEQNKYIESEELYRYLLDVKKRLFGHEHPETLHSFNSLAILFEKQGQYEKAAQLHQQVLEVREKLLGPENLDTLQSLDNLAVALGWQCRYKKMEETHQQRKGKKKERPKSTSQSLQSLDPVTEWSTHRKIEEMHRWVLEVRQRVLGMEHPDTLACLNNLGSIVYDQGRLLEAENIYKKVVEARIRVLGGKHLNVLNSLNNLGMVYWHLGKHEEAMQIHRQVLEERCEVLGPNHPHTSQTCLHLAAALKSLRKYQEAEELALRVRRSFVEMYGPDHSNTTGCQALLERIRKARDTERIQPKIEIDE